MKTNGVLSYAIVQEAGLNEYGEPIGGDVSWSVNIPCSIKTNFDNRKGRYEDGEFSQSAYIVHCELIADTFSTVRLTRYGEYLGEYEVQALEHVPDMGRIIILVGNGKVVNHS